MKHAKKNLTKRAEEKLPTRRIGIAQIFRPKRLLRNNLPIIILFLISVISSLGIFSYGITFSPLQISWFLGYLAASSMFLARIMSGRETKGLLNKAGPFIAVALQMNLFVQLTGGIDSYILPLYLLLVVITSTYCPTSINIALISFILLVEGINLAISGDDEYYLKASVIAFLLISIPSAIKYYIESESKEKTTLKNRIYRIMGSRQAITQVPDLHKGSDVKNISKDSRDDQLDQLAGRFDEVIDNILSIISSAIKEANSSIILLYNKEEERLYLQAGITKSEKGLNYQTKIPEGGGIIGWIAKEKKLFNLSNLDPSRDRLAYYNEHTRIRSLLAIPLLDNEDLEGLICVDALKEHAFTDKEEGLLQLLAKEIGYQLKNMRDKQIIHTRTHELSSILEISKALNTRLDLMHRLETMADKAKEILEYDCCFIVLIDEKETHGTIKVARGYDGTGIIDKTFKASEGLINIILKNRHFLMFSSIERKKKSMDIFPKECNITWKAKSFLGIPMMNEERVIGIFILTSQKDNAFNGYDQHIMSIVCSHAAVSISDAYLHAQVEALATTDGLTGISNHRRFQERLSAEFDRIARHPEPISLILMDLDHFKMINDNFGHPVGDLVLKKIANILLKMTRTIDTVARYGGEEFVLLLLNTDKKQAIQMAERIRKTVETTKFEFDGKKIPVTLSLGMAATPLDTKNKKELIELADKALYHSKHSGRNQATHIGDIKEAPSLH